MSRSAYYPECLKQSHNIFPNITDPLVKAPKDISFGGLIYIISINIIYKTMGQIENKSREIIQKPQYVVVGRKNDFTSADGSDMISP